MFPEAREKDTFGSREIPTASALSNVRQSFSFQSACQIKAVIALLHAAALTALVRGSHTCSVSMERKASPERHYQCIKAERAQLRNAPLLERIPVM